MIVILPEGCSASRFLSLQQPHIFEKWELELPERISFFQRVEGTNTQAKNLQKDPEIALEDISQMQENLLKSLGPPVLIILSLDTLEALYGTTELSKLISQEVRFATSEEESVIIGIKREGQEFGRGSAMPTTHWRVGLINSTLTIYGVVPQTQLYAIHLDDTRGYVAPRLISVV